MVKKKELTTSEKIQRKIDKRDKKRAKIIKASKNFEIVRYKNSGYVPSAKLNVIGMIVNATRYLIDKKFRHAAEERKREQERLKKHDRTVAIMNFLKNALYDNPYKFKVIYLQIDNQFKDVLSSILENTPDFPDYFFDIIEMNPNYKRFISKPHIILKATFKGYINEGGKDTDEVEKKFDLEAYISNNLC